MTHLDGCGLQLVTEDLREEITVETGDEVDAATDTFTFDGFDFTGLEGAFVVISGAAEAGNNGSWEVTTGADGSFESAGATGLVDEEFDPDTVTVYILRSDDPATGTWKIEVSNNYVNPKLPGLSQFGGRDTKWSDITSQFTPAIASVTAASSQYVQAYPLVARQLRVTFTPTAGLGYITVTYSAKGNR